MCAVAVRIEATGGKIANNAASQIRVIGIDAEVIHVDQDIGAGQSEVIEWRHRVRVDAQGGAAQIVSWNASVRQFHFLNSGKPRDPGQLWGRAANLGNGSEGRRLEAADLDSNRFELSDRVLATLFK